jgi:putative ABC transport system permease protein
MKLRDILTTAIGNSFRSRLRTTLTVMAIFIGAFTLTITNGLGTGINNYIDTQVASIGATDVMTVSKPAEVAEATEGPARYEESNASELEGDGPPGSTVLAMTEEDFDAIAAVDGIRSVDPNRSVRPDYVQWDGNDKYELAVSQFSGLAIDLAAGSGFDIGTAERQVILPSSYSEPLGFDSGEDAIGTLVSIGVTDSLGASHEVQATIVGLQEATLVGESASLNEPLIAAIYEAQSTGLPDSSTQEYASATATFDPAATDAEIAAIKAELVDAGYAGTTVADQIGTFQAVIDGIILVLNAFAIIALLAAGFGIINTLLMSVQERTREIGLMKAMGMSGGRIFGLFSTEAVFIGLLGSAIGAAIAMIAGALVSTVLSGGVLAGLPGLQILAFTPESILLVLALVMGIAFVASVLPASRAARQSPIDSLRYE